MWHVLRLSRTQQWLRHAGVRARGGVFSSSSLDSSRLMCTLSSTTASHSVSVNVGLLMPKTVVK